MIEPEPLQQVDRTRVMYRGRKLLYFSGCDYFRLASHPAVLRAAQRGLRRYGLNVAASRFTTGNHLLYQELERALRKFFGAPAALLVPTGYLANLVVAQALAGEFSLALVDERAHPSLKDAAQLLGCRTVEFEHRDLMDLGVRLRQHHRSGRVILLTDGLFARDGQVAPLRAYASVLPARSVILVDDCHGAGVLGQQGRGTVEHEALSRRGIIQTVTLSKAFGTFGGAVLCDRLLREQMLRKSRMLVGSTPLPLPLVAASLESLRLLQHGKAFRRRLKRKHQYLLQQLGSRGLRLLPQPGPILSIYPKARECAHLKRALLAAGIFPPFIRYPGGPAVGYFRFVISSEHTLKELALLASVLAPA